MSSKKRSKTGGTTGTNQHMIRGKRTICWDCVKACGACSWSSGLQPVDGWKVEETEFADSHGETGQTYCVLWCPEFERDSFRFGEIRMKKGETV